jgi:hypothetical protein
VGEKGDALAEVLRAWQDGTRKQVNMIFSFGWEAVQSGPVP